MATWTRVLGRTIRLAPTAVGTATRGLIHSTGIKQHGWQRVACVAVDTAPLLCTRGSGRRAFSSTSPTATAAAAAPSSAEAVMTSALRTALGATHVEVIDMSGGGGREMELCGCGVVEWRGSLRGVMLGLGGSTLGFGLGSQPVPPHFSRPALRGRHCRFGDLRGSPRWGCLCESSITVVEDSVGSCMVTAWFRALRQGKLSLALHSTGMPI